jgi:hypothetical protein
MKKRGLCVLRCIETFDGCCGVIVHSGNICLFGIVARSGIYLLDHLEAKD